MGAIKQTQEPLPPIVLMVGVSSPTDVRRVLAFDTAHAKEFFGVEPAYAYAVLNPHNESVWWVNPREDRSMFELLVSRPSFSPNQYKRWIETPQFVNYVRRDINYTIHYSLTRVGREAFDRRWHEAVKMVILGGWVSSNSGYVRRVFDGYLENAKYWWWNSGGRELTPIWRDNVTPITGTAGKPTAAEALLLFVDQLPGIPQSVQNLATTPANTWKVGDLVKMTIRDLVELGINGPDLERTRDAVNAVGLELCMTQQQIDAVKQGTGPGTQATRRLGEMSP